MNDPSKQARNQKSRPRKGGVQLRLQLAASPAETRESTAEQSATPVVTPPPIVVPAARTEPAPDPVAVIHRSPVGTMLFAIDAVNDNQPEVALLLRLRSSRIDTIP